MRGVRRARWAAIAAPFVAGLALAEGPVLHEPVPDDANDESLDTWMAEGALPTRVEGPDGPARPKDPTRPPSGGELPYARGSVRVDTSENATFEADRDTRAPSSPLPYDDPFSPRVEPFKRLSVFDRVDASYTLRVARPRLEPVPLEEGGPRPHEDSFYGDLVVDLAGAQAVRIPTPGPGARLLAVRATLAGAQVPVHVQRDGAENWFVTATTTGRARLVFQVAVDRDAFGGPFPEERGRGGEDPRTLLPPSVVGAAAEVARAIGVDGRMPFRRKMALLVAYFRSFEESSTPSTASRDVYRDLALGRRGVCRHRAFAFLVTAQGLGIPTRLVLNEAHAWVEVHDGTRFRRVDLGGAGDVASRSEERKAPLHAPAEDPFSWPEGARRGADLGLRGGGGADTVETTTAPVPVAPPGDRRPATRLTLATDGAAFLRGAPLAVHGDAREAERGGGTCPHVSVQLVLTRGGSTSGAASRRVLLGVLVTDEQGRFAGSPVVPAGIATGPWELVAETSGDARCGVGSSEGK